LKTIYVIENFEHLPQKKIGRFLGIDWFRTPYWWISPIWIIIVGFIIAHFRLNEPISKQLVFDGIIYAFLIGISILLHSIGHLIAGKLVKHPMKGNLLTATLPVNRYDGIKYPSRVHLIRSMGGPLLNLFVGFILFIIDANIFKNHFISFMAYVNLLFFITAMMPIPTLDGGVLVRELRNWRK